MTRKLVFATRVWDLKRKEFVNGGVKIDITEEEANAILPILDRLNEARRFGIAALDGVELNQCELNTPLANSKKYKYSYDILLEEDGNYTRGCSYM